MDNKGKLFCQGFCFCSCYQDKFVMAVAPGHAYLHTIKILYLDNFLTRDNWYRDTAPVLATNFVTGDNPDSYREAKSASSPPCTPAAHRVRTGRGVTAFWLKYQPR